MDQSNNIGWHILGALQDKFTHSPYAFALHCEEASLTADHFIQRVAGRICALKGFGISVGNTVFCACERGADFWIDTIALWCVGAIPVPFERSVSPDSFAHMLAKSEARYIIGDDTGFDSDVLMKVPMSQQECCALKDIPASVLPHNTAPDDPAIILFTSGSTGEPKGVLLSHKAYLGNARATQKALKLRSDDLLFFAIPFRFVSAQSHFIVSLLSGTSVHCTEKKLMLGDFIRTASTHDITAFGGSPLQARWIVEALNFYADKPERERPFSPLRWVMTSGDHMPVSVIDSFLAHKPDLAMRIVYGMTELAGRFCVNDLSQSRSGLGFPIEGLSADIRDENKCPLPAGEIGNVYANGKYLFEGYINDLEKTRDTVSKTCGLYTGDVGYKDDQGHLYLVGRSDDVFKVAGLKVSGLTISAAILSLVELADLAVVPMNDPMAGYLPHVLYVPKDGGDLDVSALMSALREHLPPNHLPRKFSKVDSIPRTASGKIDRRALTGLVEGLESKLSHS
jgi:acyl-coenzyme A synthetase/AMP-(fatty) acid ligase